jgi:S-methylmethionine-dependent homocysteine/selenocysteine methylase
VGAAHERRPHRASERAAGEREVVVIDGATGTELEVRGVPMDGAAWCGVANLDYAEVVAEVHADYIRAGAGVVIANTFSNRPPAARRCGHRRPGRASSPTQASI